METQLQDIIDKIHDEGVKGAEERARQIVESAEKQARETVDKAKTEAQSIVKQAEQEAQKHRAAGDAALKQSSRDLLLAVRTRLTELFDSVQREQVGEALSADRMGSIIAELVQSWSSSSDDRFEVLVSEKDRDAVEASMRSALSDKLKNGVDLRPVRGVNAGFRVGTKDGAAYYDFTDETLAELLAAYLNPRLAEIMKNAAQE